MAGSGYWEAIQVFHESLQAAVARVTPAILLREGPLSPDEPIGRLRLSESVAPLGSSRSDYALSMAMRFRVESLPMGDDRWDIQTFAYSYLLFRDDREVIAYH